MIPTFINVINAVTILLIGVSCKIPSEVEGVPIPNSVSSTEANMLSWTNLRRTLCQPGQTSPFYRYDKETEKCYEIGGRGPCGQNMVFNSQENSLAYGECECDYENNDVPPMYHDDTKKCYFLYTKAYCKQGDWLVFDQDSKTPRCEEDRCSDYIQFDWTDTSVIIPFKGRCVPLNSRSNECKSGEVVTFIPEAMTASCGPKNSKNQILGTTILSLALKCRPGSRRNIKGLCRQDLGVKISSGAFTK